MSQPLTNDGLHAVFLFIAELLGLKEPTEDLKAKAGMTAYLNNSLVSLDYSIEDDRKDAHENIWLTRMYAKLDEVFGFTGLVGPILKGRNPNLYELDRKSIKWDIPIELDASASMLQYIGILLNDYRLLDITNVLGDTLKDPWSYEGVPRASFKAVATPRLYGSSRASHELLSSKAIKFTLAELSAINAELSSGALGLADQFKELIINYCKPRETMQVKVFNEEFTIECNRYKHIGERTIQYDIYDTETKAVRRIQHTTTKSVPDLEQFRRYFMTLLVHNLDSQVADKVIGKVMAKYGWGIDIHDAFIVHPNAAKDVRAWYAECIEDIYANRKQILSDYFNSIGISGEAQAQWSTIQSMVVPVQGAFKCNPMALK